MDEYVYDAFISYSHRDMAWARWLQRRLETFPIPREFQGEDRSRRRLRVFRDQTDLAGAELRSSLEKELRASRYLIVLCTPRSAASLWVNREVLLFRSLRGSDHIIPFIAEGEPGSDDSALECFPEALRTGGDPLGANVQEIGKDKAFLKVISLLLGVRFNRLVDREKRRRTHTALIAGGLAALVLASTSLLLWRNAVVARENQALSYDIYGMAIVAIGQKDRPDPEDVAFLRTSAEAGNADAAFYLAYCYSRGWGVEPDPAEAFSWYSRSAEAGNTEAMVALANCYETGVGVPADPAQSYAWNLRAAQAGYAGGMVNTGICCLKGDGTDKDETAAFGWFMQAAESGDIVGMNKLAECYLAGVGTEADPARAFFWAEKMAEAGSAEGMYNLGLMYQYGFGTQEDPRLAYEWYRRSADAGDADGMYMTGWCTENSYGTEDAALEWYRRAAKAGSAEAAEALARLGG
ncbi:MAG: toll/interleukin-1 receptor domain-containing protein [Oscillospiraceae bacterium]|nr:toll/interleukin-1 receptor domain-containing protein [Oscillospiraceae bacterium]